MKKKLKKSDVRSITPLIQEIEVEHYYDDEWKTNFITIYSTESTPAKVKSGDQIISQELNICFNTKKDFNELIKALKSLKKKFKKAKT